MPSTTLLGRLGGSSGGCRAAIDTSVFTIEWLIWLPRVARAIERRGDGALGRSFDEDGYLVCFDYRRKECATRRRWPSPISSAPWRRR